MNAPESPSTSSSPSKMEPGALLTADGTNTKAVLVPAEASALAKAPEPKPLLTLPTPVGGSQNELDQIAWLEKLAISYDKMPEDVKDSLILMRRAFPATGGGMTYYTAPQCIMIVRYCRSKGLDIHGDHWWFDPRNYKIGTTVSGLRAEARHLGIKLGPPQLERIEREWPAAAPRFKGYENSKDFGYRCKMRVGDTEDFATYEAWFSTSGKDYKGNLRAGPWTDMPDHMLQVRAQGNCIKNALGSGISQMPDDIDED